MLKEDAQSYRTGTSHAALCETDNIDYPAVFIHSRLVKCGETLPDSVCRTEYDSSCHSPRDTSHARECSLDSEAAVTVATKGHLDAPVAQENPPQRANVSLYTEFSEV